MKELGNPSNELYHSIHALMRTMRPGPEKNFASRNTRLGDQLRWKIEAKSRRISFVLQKSIGRIQRN